MKFKRGKKTESQYSQKALHRDDLSNEEEKDDKNNQGIKRRPDESDLEFKKRAIKELEGEKNVKGQAIVESKDFLSMKSA